VLPLLPEKPHYPKLGACPKYGDVALLHIPYSSLPSDANIYRYTFFILEHFLFSELSIPPHNLIPELDEIV
jgi:hypothetical protein